MNWSAVAPIGMLFGSNLVMNYAWYGHLKSPGRALWLAVLISWGIAFFEYCLAVPANRIGEHTYSLSQLKTVQEVMSLSTFVIVAWFMFGQRPTPSMVIGFAFIATGAFFIFKAPIG